jgi:hypothetical protein
MRKEDGYSNCCKIWKNIMKEDGFSNCCKIEKNMMRKMAAVTVAI